MPAESTIKFPLRCLIRFFNKRMKYYDLSANLHTVKDSGNSFPTFWSKFEQPVTYCPRMGHTQLESKFLKHKRQPCIRCPNPDRQCLDFQANTFAIIFN